LTAIGQKSHKVAIKKLVKPGYFYYFFARGEKAADKVVTECRDD